MRAIADSALIIHEEYFLTVQTYKRMHGCLTKSVHLYKRAIYSTTHWYRPLTSS